MKYLIVLLVLSRSLMAATYDGQSILRRSFATHLHFQMIQNENKENVMRINSQEGIYDFLVSIEGLRSIDKSEQSVSQTPSNTKESAVTLSISKKFLYGVDSNLFIKRSNTNFDLMSSAVKRSRSELGASVSISLLENRFGIIDRSNFKVREYERKLSGIKTKNQITLLSLKVLDTFYRWVVVSESLEINKELLKNAKYLLHLAMKRGRRGVKNIREILIHKSNISNIKNSILELTKSLSNFQEQISYLTNDSRPQYSFDPMSNSSDKEEEVIEAIYSGDSDITQFPSIKIAATSMEISRRKLIASESSKLPSLDLSFGATGVGNKEDSGDSTSDAYAFSRPQYSVGLKLTFPIGNNLAKSEFYSKLAKRERDRQDYDDTKNRVRKILAVYSRNVRLISEQIVVSKTHVSNEKAKYENEIREYKLGARSSTDLIKFQNDYLKSRLDHLSNVISLKQAIDEYLGEKDQLLEYYSIRAEL